MMDDNSGNSYRIAPRVSLGTKLGLGCMVMIGIFLVIGGIGGCGLYNSYFNCVKADQRVNRTEGQLQNVLTEQAQLLPLLAQVVKAAGLNEKEIIIKVNEAQARLGQIQVSGMTQAPGRQQELYAAQRQFASAMYGAAIMIKQQQPHIEATQLYKNLMHQIEGSLHRTTVARKDVQDATEDYNVQISGLGKAVWGYKDREFFKAPAEDQRAPTNLNLETSPATQAAR